MTSCVSPVPCLTHLWLVCYLSCVLSNHLTPALSFTWRMKKHTEIKRNKNHGPADIHIFGHEDKREMQRESHGAEPCQEAPKTKASALLEMSLNLWTSVQKARNRKQRQLLSFSQFKRDTASETTTALFWRGVTSLMLWISTIKLCHIRHVVNYSKHAQTVITAATFMWKGFCDKPLIVAVEQQMMQVTSRMHCWHSEAH